MVYHAQWLQLDRCHVSRVVLAKRVGHLAGQLGRADMQLYSAQEVVRVCTWCTAVMTLPRGENSWLRLSSPMPRERSIKQGKPRA